MKYFLSTIDTLILEPIDDFLEEKGGAPMFRQKRGMDPLAAGVMGIMIGMAGTAIGIAMTDEKKRQKVITKAKIFADWGNDKMQGLKQSADQMINSATETSEDIKKKTSKAIRDTK